MERKRILLLYYKLLWVSFQLQTHTSTFLENIQNNHKAICLEIHRNTQLELKYNPYYLNYIKQTVFIVVKCHMEINLNSSETIYVEYFHILTYDKSHIAGILIICLSCVLIFWLQNNEF